MGSKRRRNAAAREAAALASSAATLPAAPEDPGARDGIVATLLAVMMFVTPAIGVPHEQMLQDTLKSMVVAFLGLGAAGLFFWQRRGASTVQWHGLVLLPLLLMAHALGSMAWSHTYLAGVEAVRWFVFALLLWLGLQVLTREQLPRLAAGVFGGAVVASLWTALQFWFDMRLFPQGPHPASTFVNRNFFAEFAACTLPFGAWLLLRARHRAAIAAGAAGLGFVIVAILMTGTRSALTAMWLQLLLVLPFFAWRCRRHLAWPGWDRRLRLVAAGVLAATVLGLGNLETGNAQIAADDKGLTPIARGLQRTAAIQLGDESLNLRLIMWQATLRMVADRPLAGVGAGAWENEIPRYQRGGAQLETDYYAHNEFLQLLAEYGAAGWAFLLALFAYLLRAAWRTLAPRDDEAQAESAGRAVLLTSLLALLVVSNAGFPWRMATTGALFALCLAGLAASDARSQLAARTQAAARWSARQIAWRPAWSRTGLAGTAAAVLLAGYISQQAAACEEKIVQATRMALMISGSRDPNDPRWEPAKAQMLQLIREGTAINPHYRKITPMVADELARWGDWRNATWIWESVLGSRPYVVAIMSNAARGRLAMGEPEKSLEYLRRAREVQPDAPTVRSLEVIILSRTGQEPAALNAARAALNAGIFDFDLANNTFALAWRAGDHATALRAMQLRQERWPEHQAQGHVQLGRLYAEGIRDEAKALASFRAAMDLVPPVHHGLLQREIPPAYWARLGLRGNPAP